MNVVPVELYTDGSCLGNPGPGGIGYIIRYSELDENTSTTQVKTYERSQGYALTTNNRMEILAGIKGLEEILINIRSGNFKNVSNINVKSDSQYFCDAINKRWINKWQQNNWITFTKNPVKNKDLWESLLSVMNGLKSLNVMINIEHIPGHAGHEFNEACDKLATAASSNSVNHISDEVYEKQSRRN